MTASPTQCSKCWRRAAPGSLTCGACMPDRQRQRMVALSAPLEDEGDPRLWALLFTRARLRKGWSYTRLAVESGIPMRSSIRACTTGHCNSLTALKLAVTLGLILALPEPPKPLTAHQAQFGR